MSIYYSIDGGEPSDLASNKGWGDCCRFVESLAGHDELKRLCAYGWSERLEELREDASSARGENCPPKVSRVLEFIIDACRDEPTDTVLTINNGIVASEDTNG